ncbi:translation initiation factor [Horticoccus luteus]|uniref:Translation initiation factor n=1 Tax=Horticoccus luteus TaxID=2862869 RepID=A0A8F9TV78_9BACT|nr:translation initiation factor [Horticoccus luteus]QYM79874.1 translation initiation factor [Horticoccus luteus]
MSGNGKVPTSGGHGLGQNPFGALNASGLPVGPSPVPPGAQPTDARPAPMAKNRGRVDIVRETGGRGGKTVTVVKGFVGIGALEKEQLAKKMRAACGCGGTVKEGQIELQGDKREQVAKILADAGFRPVFAGG